MLASPPSSTPRLEELVKRKKGKGENLSPATVNRDLRRALNWAVDREYLKKAPSFRGVMLRKHNKDPTIIPETDFLAMLMAVDTVGLVLGKTWSLTPTPANTAGGNIWSRVSSSLRQPNKNTRWHCVANAHSEQPTPPHAPTGLIQVNHRGVREQVAQKVEFSFSVLGQLPQQGVRLRLGQRQPAKEAQERTGLVQRDANDVHQVGQHHQNFQAVFTARSARNSRSRPGVLFAVE